ncbi:RagB/SusD family nutrient uptake outer membrane protein [Pedobacter nyackensis]|uniref:SusD family protein n=1 Tax=Pedobacter nyackensis TaxID=475255 RepID=A0A1W2B9M0_9SPHI|nr:RagB/SusD family nutrient uptake outer membrane protein [Pedobacter nyackensis]SMC69677.1 SusD family protein [Pedobacter nyackensis]
MKKFSYTIVFVAIVCSTLISCKKFLEKEPIGQTGKNTLFETVDGAKLAINGCYYSLLNYYSNEFGMYADVTSDNLISRTSASVMLPQFNFQSTVSDDELAVGHIWLNIYETLNNVNNLLEAVPTLKTKFPNQVKTLDSINGQALAMRALCHFDLSRVYAQPYNYTSDASHLGIPVLLKTPSPGQQISRKTMKETYDQIILDLNNALPLLQQNVNHTTQAAISYHAALALLSRVYLYKGDWAQCIATANQVIADNGYQLANANNYKSMFLTTQSANANPKIENIFQLTNVRHNNSSTSVYVVFSDAAGAQYSASAKVKSLYDSDDIRSAQMFTVPASGLNAGKSLTTKYGNGTVTTVPPPLIQIIRLSEVYLNRAEAKWNLQRYTEAAEDLSIISNRAHPGRTITITYTSSSDLYKQIADERNRELCFENHRFFDTIRRKENLLRGGDCNSNICGLTYPNDKFVLPIPTKEVEANKGMIQNPGFN